MSDERGSGLPLTQNMIGGLALIGLGGLACWLTSDLSQGSLSAMGAGFLPRWLALGMATLGVALVGIAFRSSDDEPFGHVSWRGLGLILLAIIAFAILIRPFHFGTTTLPGFGLVVAGPFAVIIGGLATPEARLRELIVLSLLLTALCMLLFGDLLNLPIPIFPQFLTSLLPGVPAKLLLRGASTILIVISAAAILLHLRQQKQGIGTSAETGNPHE